MSREAMSESVLAAAVIMIEWPLGAPPFKI
jgi:hypothetical protein